ncbi:hypothetical protein BGZ76_010455 [Entomortierella beljakovae]|nr:hypothetical protein BGZ76_010455 [Entomortierella beljakovae]
MPYPQNFETAIEVEKVVRDNGAIPATIAIIDGQIQIGLERDQIQKLAKLGRDAVKASRRDLAVVMAKKQTGATTVSATMILAHRAGIPIFATGGIGGVHRGYENTMDASADLTELGRTPVTVVCAGVKSILDIGRTLEFLETQGVTVATYGPTLDFPAFFTRHSGFKSMINIETPMEAAELIASNQAVHLQSGIVIGVPIPESDAMDDKLVDEAINLAVEESIKLGILGKESTPFLLKRVNELTGGHSLKSNIALVKQNASIAAKIAKDFSTLQLTVLNTISSALRFLDTNSNVQNLRSHTQTRSYSTSARRLKQGPIMVIGGTVVDITATAYKATASEMLDSSFPGITRMSLGGVGRNIAEGVSKLNLDGCIFVSAISGRDTSGGSKSLENNKVGNPVDLLGSWLIEEVRRCGLRNLEVITVPGARTATYTAIHDLTGHLLSAVADMDIFELIPPTFFEPTSVVKCTRPLDKSMERLLADGALTYASPNNHELREMAKVSRNLSDQYPSGERNEDLYLENLLMDAYLVSQFIPTLFIKLGSKGALYFQRNVENKRMLQKSVDLEYIFGLKSDGLVDWKLYPAHTVMDIKSVTGAGDSFAASVVTSLHHLKKPQSNVRDGFLENIDKIFEDGQIAAALTLQTHETVSPKLSQSPQAEKLKLISK